jgi:hypothetical protein
MVPQDHQGPLAEFRAFYQDAKKLVALLAVGALVAPVLTYFLGVASPYPNQALMNFVPSVACVFALMIVFQLWLKGRASKKRRDKYLVASAMGTLLCLILYVGFFSLFVVRDAEQQSVRVIGFAYLPGIEELRNTEIPPMSDVALLRNFYGEPERIWTKSSLTFSRMVLLLCWIVFWFLFAMTISVFLAGTWITHSKHQGQA